MAQLSSPGVSVTVIDESFYTPAAPGTVPLIIVASQENKQNSSGTGIAPGTLKANAGKVYLLTSQMDLGTTFGIPFFQTDASNNPVHAGEVNEYGLQAAYSFLGVSNRAYVVRADLDTQKLLATAIAPVGAPEDGTFWFDTSNTQFGLFEWNAASGTTTGGQTFTNKSVTVITDVTKCVGSAAGTAPLASVGQVGDYAIVATSTLNKMWMKKYLTDTAAGTWVEVGTPAWAASWPTATGTVSNPTLSNVGTSFSGVISTGNGSTAGTILTVTTAVTGGTLAVGSELSGTNIPVNTHITAVNSASNAASAITGTTLTVTGAVTGTISLGMVVAGGAIPVGTYITAFVSGTGGAGTYTVSATVAQASTAVTFTSYTVSRASLAAVVNPITTGGDTLTINGNLITGVTFATLATQINDLGISGVTASEINGYLNLYSTGVALTLSGTTVAKVGLLSTTYIAPKLQLSPHFSIPTYKSTENSGSANGYPTGSLWIKTTNVNKGADWIIKKYNSATRAWIEQSVRLYANGESALAAIDPRGGGINLAVGQTFVKYNDDGGTPSLANFKIYGRSGVGATSITGSAITTGTFTAGSNSFTLQQSVVGSSALPTATTITFVAASTAADSATFLAAFSAAVSDSNIVASLNSDNSITITHSAGGDIHFVDGAVNFPLAKIFTVGTTANYYADSNGLARNFVATLWSSTTGSTAFAPASATAPTTRPADGTLWFNSSVSDVDIMVHNGTTWVGYLNFVQNGIGGTSTDPAGPIVTATEPTVQSDGTPLANGDLWINTEDFDNYPHIYKYDYLNKKWVLVDNADQTTENGILFFDARWTADGTGTGPSTIKSLLSVNFVDFDAPDPALYPKGMLLWNLRRSGNNVLKYERGYVNTNARNTRFGNALMTAYYPDRWVSNAANQIDGSGSFGRKAQRAVVLQALNALINANQQIRDEDSRQFNLLACPGYLETLSTLIDLNTSRGETSFIVADSPARLTADATTLSNWGQNVAGAAVDGENGLIATNSYAAVYYPWGFTTDLLGNNIVVPPSHIMLRTIALSDNVSYPWFAPAGVRRGGVTNASSVGYVDAQTGEFNTVALNTGQRDTLAGVHVNPITYIAGTGLVAYGQKTRQLIASSLDRINVARLVIYLRYQLNQIAKPFIFEPNDTITRNEIKQQVEKMLLELTGQRALYDYIVVCDTSNNTPARIDASELHVDIAIEPVKAVEFIYIPMRLENTGAIKGL